MLFVPEAGGARSPAGFLRRPSLARRARLLQVRWLLQVSDGPALHGRAELPLLLGGVQKENHGLESRRPSREHLWVEPQLEPEAGKMNWVRTDGTTECLLALI